MLHYLKAVEALKSDDGTKVIAKMKEMPTDDPLFGKGTIRVDGRKIHPAYLVEVKKPSESKGPWDYYKVRATIPADQAFRPLKDGEVPAGQVTFSVAPTDCIDGVERNAGVTENQRVERRLAPLQRAT